jgi:sigma-B regulation protein RsbU (phosphoserine phosphatase)
MDSRLDTSRLESLLESARILSSSLRLEDQLNHLLRTVMGRLLVTRAMVAVREDGGLRVASVRGVPRLKPGNRFDPEQASSLGFALDAPIGPEDAPVGHVWLGRPARGELDEGEQEFLQALLGLAATSISNAQAHAEVIRSNQELRALLDLGRGLAATTEPESVAQMLMLSISGRFGVLRHGLVTWKEGQPAVERLKGLDPLDTETIRALLGDEPEPKQHNGLTLLPIRSNESTVGCVALGPRMSQTPYSNSDLEFIGGMVAQAAVAFENCWNFREAFERQQLEKELNLAAAIQRDLFPKALPALPHTDMAARNRQARAVGGDYYDVLPFGNGDQFFVVVDISGKGISASLLMANIQATLRALLVADSTLAAVGARTNDLLYASTPANKYATGIMVRYDPNSGAAEYLNGGHNEGVLLRASGAVEFLKPTGLPIGLFPKREYEVHGFTMEPGDLLLLYSDGVPDACRAGGDEFGMERMIEELRAFAALPASEIAERLLASIDEFVQGAPQFDDITMMVVKRLAD